MRDYRPFARVLKADLETLLQHDPEAFDCLVFIAKSAAHDETVTVVPDVVGSLDSEERAQEYAEPVPARARIAHDPGQTFEAMGGTSENFFASSQPINLVLSVTGVRKYSLIQWLEYADVDAEKPTIRTVYVLNSTPIGRTMGVGVIHACLPLPAMGELPAMPPDVPDPATDTETGDAFPGDVAGGY